MTAEGHPLEGARRFETISTGFDDFVETLGEPPYATGLRVPPLVGPIYRFLACMADLNIGDELVGMRQFGAIASYVNQGGEVPPPAPLYLESRPLVTAGWHFSDTPPPIWVVTAEPLATFVSLAGPFDQDSFIFRDTTGPALVYETATFPALPLLPGYLGLDSYTPPPRKGILVSILRDIRFPQQQNEFFALRKRFRHPTRVRVYVEVQQTDPDTRFQPDFSTTLDTNQLSFVTGMVPEERFLVDFPNAILHSVGASLIIDRQEGTEGKHK